MIGQTARLKKEVNDWKNRKLNEPGTVFEYNDVRVNLLAYSLLQVWKTIARDT
jgi:hypothetical protein